MSQSAGSLVFQDINAITHRIAVDGKDLHTTQLMQ
jgi:hypothetical protein